MGGIEHRLEIPGRDRVVESAAGAYPVAGGGIPDRLPRELPHLGRRAVHQHPLDVDAAEQDQLRTPLPHLAQVHSRLMLERMQAVDAGGDQIRQDGHQVAVRVVEVLHPLGVAGGDGALEAGEEMFPQEVRRKEQAPVAGDVLPRHDDGKMPATASSNASLRRMAMRFCVSK